MWEYKKERNALMSLIDFLNYNGKLGWELVQVIKVPESAGTYECLFKRKI